MRKIKQLILHIGTVKAGSTSIQRSLGRGRDTLLEHNIYFPGIKPFNHVFSFAPLFMDNPEYSTVFRKELLAYEEDKGVKVAKYRKAWLKEIKTCKQDHFIISGEGFSLAFFDENAVRRLKNFVEQYFEEFKIIIYVRHYDAWIPSQFQQVIKNGRMTIGLKRQAKRYLKCPPNISYRQSLSKWINVFGRENMVVRPFDPVAFYKGSLLADFFHSVGLPADNLPIPEIRTNESVGKYAVTFLQNYNQSYPLFVNEKVNKDRGLARQYFPVYLLQNIPDEKFNFELVYTAEQAERFNEEIDFVNQFYTDGYQFPRVSPGGGEISFPLAEDIPIDFYVELVNNYNKQIENLQRRIELLRTPYLLRAMKKFKYTNKVLRKLQG